MKNILSKNELAIIIDGMGLAYRSLYSKRDSDFDNPVAKKFIRYILNILNDYSPDYMCICLDSERDNNYRKQLLSTYKSNRKERPKEIEEGVQKVKEFCDMFDIKYLQIDNQESDDIAYSLVTKLTKEKIYSIAVTVDGDWTQMFSKYCKIAKPTKTNIKVLRTWKDVKDNFGKITVDNPNQVIELLGLTGDKSDGIHSPVPKVGQKRATEIINKYGTIRNMFASKDELPYNIRNYENEIYKTRNLVKLYNKIELPDIEYFKYGKFDYYKCLKWMENQGLAEKLFNNIIDLDF